MGIFTTLLLIVDLVGAYSIFSDAKSARNSVQRVFLIVAGCALVFSICGAGFGLLASAVCGVGTQIACLIGGVKYGALLGWLGGVLFVRFLSNAKLGPM